MNSRGTKTKLLTLLSLWRYIMFLNLNILICYMETNKPAFFKGICNLIKIFKRKSILSLLNFIK